MIGLFINLLLTFFFFRNLITKFNFFIELTPINKGTCDYFHACHKDAHAGSCGDGKKIQRS